jgi:hypothetical protein
MTDRTLTAGVVTETEAEEYTSAGFVLLDFDTDPVYVWTGTRSITTTLPTESSHTYLGIGTLGSIDGISESADRSVNGVKMTLSGIGNDLLANALGQNYQGRTAKIWIVYFDANEDIVPDPLLLFGGQMDVMSLIDGDSEGAITLSCESRDAALKRTSESLLTAEEQKRVYPNDKGLDFVQELQGKPLTWGEKGGAADRGNPQPFNPGHIRF